jgi:hypothetical protein
MTVAFLIAILIVATVSMVFNVAYILHELGWFPRWFPHGRRGDRWPELSLTPSLSHLIAMEVHSREQRDLVTDHPSSIRLRRAAHPEVYEYDDPAAKLNEVLQRAKENPTASALDDLITLSNVIGSASDPTEQVQRLLVQVIDFLQQHEVRVLGGQV